MDAYAVRSGPQYRQDPLFRNDPVAPAGSYPPAQSPSRQEAVFLIIAGSGFALGKNSFSTVSLGAYSN